MTTPHKHIRCAIYTRKSSEEGLEQEFNSLQAQREACEDFIKSQKHEGWNVIKTLYDDGGFSGGTMNRPALQQLLKDIRERKIDVVVVYKVDRLTRSLMDFSKIISTFDEYDTSFVAVTQQFNTTSSMGRLTLNVLLSFAQFEREVTGERIRDKIAASKKKGMWMGGVVPFGYAVKEKKLFINEEEAKVVRHIFIAYLKLGCVRLLYKELAKDGIYSRDGHIISRGALYRQLSNQVYIGMIKHRKEIYLGQHEPIIDKKLWDDVQQQLKDNAVKIRNHKTEPSLLQGKLFDEKDESLTPSHSKKGQKYFRYYISHRLTTGLTNGTGWRLPAKEVENTVVEAIHSILSDEVFITENLQTSGLSMIQITEAIEETKNISQQIASEPKTINKILNRINLEATGMHITITLAGVLMSKFVPMHIKRRGTEKRLVLNDGRIEKTNIDQTLIRVVAKARLWFDELSLGHKASLADIARDAGVGNSYVSHLMPLAFLSPEIVEAILAGKQPADLTADKLIKHTTIPADWSEQKQLLGF